jgi:uncharacterized protein YdhG (YjbR/CyaY superfamily)
MAARKSDGLSASERRAVRERAAEVRTAATRPKATKAERDTEDVLATIAAMPEPDRTIARRLHAAITDAVPELAPRLWYSQPAYAWNGKVLCFVRSGAKDDVRYMTLGFNDVARLDDGTFWATSFAVTDVTDDVAATVTRLVQRAASSETSGAASP